MQLLKEAVRARAGVVNLLGIAIVLAVGVNLVAAGLSSWLTPWGGAVLGAVLVFTTSIVVVLVQLRSRREAVVYRGFLPIYKGVPVRVPGYHLANSAEMYLRAVLDEKPALAAQWDAEPLLPTKSGLPNVNGAQSRLIREAVEYVLLDSLSTNLTDYFNKDSWFRTRIRTHERDHLRDLFPDNRILEFLSSPYEDRDGFAERRSAEDGEVRTRGRAIAIYSGTRIFSEFRLNLPKDVHVRRLAPGRILFDSRYMQTELKVEFDGASYNLDRDFLEAYIGIKDHDFVYSDSGNVWSVRLTFESRLRWRSFFSLRAWRLHKWAESFAEKSRNRFDGASFLSSISWEATRTMLRVQKTLGSSSNSTHS